MSFAPWKALSDAECKDANVRKNRKDAYGFFLEPVDQSVITDYCTVIKHPMDLGMLVIPFISGERAETLKTVTCQGQWNPKSTPKSTKTGRNSRYSHFLVNMMHFQILCDVEK